MSFKKFCPKCGKETDLFVDKICKDCFLKNKNLFEIEKISIKICKFCGRLFISAKESEYSDELIKDEISSKIKILSQVKQPKIFVEIKRNHGLDFSSLVKVNGLILGQLVDQEKVINFQLKETTCDACMKLNSDYREAIVQLRADNLNDQEAMLNITKNFLAKEKSKDALSDTSKIGKVKNGFDLWVGSKKAAAKVSRELAHIYNTKIILSKKLIGEEKSGERKYRYTFCIKMN